MSSFRARDLPVIFPTPPSSGPVLTSRPAQLSNMGDMAEEKDVVVIVKQSSQGIVWAATRWGCS